MDRRQLVSLLGAVSGATALSLLSSGALAARAQRLHALAGGGDVLNSRQLAVLRAAAERIIPATDTPGAAGAEVEVFVDRLAARWMSDVERRRLIDGLAELDARSRARGSAGFVELASGDQDAVLSALELEAEAAANPTDTFWRQLKWCTLYGYYTSNIGIEQELKVLRIPGRFEGSVPLKG